MTKQEIIKSLFDLLDAVPYRNKEELENFKEQADLKLKGLHGNTLEHRSNLKLTRFAPWSFSASEDDYRKSWNAGKSVFQKILQDVLEDPKILSSSQDREISLKPVSPESTMTITAGESEEEFKLQRATPSEEFSDLHKETSPELPEQKKESFAKKSSFQKIIQGLGVLKKNVLSLIMRQTAGNQGPLLQENFETEKKIEEQPNSHPTPGLLAVDSFNTATENKIPRSEETLSTPEAPAIQVETAAAVPPMNTGAGPDVVPENIAVEPEIPPENPAITQSETPLPVELPVAETPHVPQRDPLAKTAPESEVLPAAEPEIPPATAAETQAASPLPVELSVGETPIVPPEPANPELAVPVAEPTAENPVLKEEEKEGSIPSELPPEEQTDSAAKDDLANLKATGPEKPLRPRVFLLHGEDQTMTDKVVECLGKHNVEIVLLKSRDHAHKPIAQKLTESSDVSFAISLLSFDVYFYSKDQKVKDAKLSAHPHIIFETAFLIGRFGRHKVFVLYDEKKTFELPSLFFDAYYIPYDRERVWQKELIKCLQQQGYPVSDKKS